MAASVCTLQGAEPKRKCAAREMMELSEAQIRKARDTYEDVAKFC